MEAVVFDGKTLSLKFETNYPMPKIVKENEVIIKVEYSGICGTDVHIIKGEFPASKERPLPLGHEFSGVVHEVGTASVLKKGQKVVVDPNRSCSLCEYCRKGAYQHCSTNGVDSVVGIWKDGGWAQYVCVPQDQVFVLPDEINTKQGALCEPFSCVSHGFDRASPLSVGDRILILGSGIIGNLWVTALHHHGHRDVTVSGRNKRKLEFFKNMDTGYRLVSPDTLTSENELYDVIIDCTGSAEAMSISLNFLRPGGKYVLFGCCPANDEATVNPFQIYVKELTIIGAKVNPFSFPSTIGWFKVMGARYRVFPMLFFMEFTQLDRGDHCLNSLKKSIGHARNLGREIRLNTYLDYDKLGVKTYALSEYETAFEDVKTGAAAKAMFKL